MTDSNAPSRCGLVALVGSPNVGKSSLINALVGASVGIISPKPNTTRVVVRGVVAEGPNQIVFVDTPGLNASHKGLDRLLVQQARGALEDADVVALVIDASKGFDTIAREETAKLKENKHQKGVLILNKVDRIHPKDKLIPLMQEAQEAGCFAEVFAVSALKGGGLRDVLPRLAKLLPEGPWLFPPEMETDMPLPLRLAEVTREKAMFFLQKEVPYGVAVLTEEVAEDPDGMARITQKLLVAREGHKGMVVGQGGQMLQKIGTSARKAMQSILGTGVRLNLRVAVDADWQERMDMLRQMGLRE